MILAFNCFFNSSNKFYHIQIGYWIAQIVFEKLYQPILEGYEFNDKDNERGMLGFGSAGL